MTNPDTALKVASPLPWDWEMTAMLSIEDLIILSRGCDGSQYFLVNL